MWLKILIYVLLFLLHWIICHINYFVLHTYIYIYVCKIFSLFRCVLSSLFPLRSVGRSNFDSGLHNIIMLIEKNDILITKNKYYIKNGINRGY